MTSETDLAALRGIRVELTAYNHRLREAQRARALVSLRLLSEGADAGEVRLQAGVSWATIATWCERSPYSIPRDTVRSINAHADDAARRSSEKKRRSSALRGDRPQSDSDRAYRHRVEELGALKEAFEAQERVPCEPFTQDSTDEIDALQGIVDNW